MKEKELLKSSNLPDSIKSAIKSTSKFVHYRKSIYASINGTKGNLIKLHKSSLLSKKEKEKLQEIIDKFEELRMIMHSNNIDKK